MTGFAKLEIDGRLYELPIAVGSCGERAIDISTLRADSGYITLDEGYRNTGSCSSAITFIDGERGILRYRGIPIEILAEKSDFLEVAQLLIFGHLPTAAQTQSFSDLLTENAALHTSMSKHYDAFPEQTNPMAILSAMINTLSAHDRPKIEPGDDSMLERYAANLMSKVRTIAAGSYKTSVGEPIIYPRRDHRYAQNFLHMMFSLPYKEFYPNEAQAHALDLFFMLHADHEQNCSTSTVRMVASGNANLYASCSAGVDALWGSRHGGANVAVVQMLQRLRQEGIGPGRFLADVKDRRNSVRLMGFGHRVYKTMDPRARLLGRAADELLEAMHVEDPLLALARELADAARADDYFVERDLYPNVDFYSGVILRALGIPLSMYTVMFAIGRVPGWIANWREISFDESTRIYRPRQIYTGRAEVPWIDLEDRGR
ncbi:citrate synthase [uncultured Propionibacterium sp.]|uniref:citrate synthase n=1 Tax=uncultured Propionibacterium sp. TaxID=218066 RepID=UPI00292DE1F0|nr:citrate synthase [uncultured Propionibacterium sp.]